MFTVLMTAAVAAAPVPAAQLRMDYPPAAMRSGAQGRVEFEVEVDPAGVATACRVLHSSGHASLDAEACRSYRTFRFRPAVDENGNAVAGTYRGTQEWRLGPVAN